MFYRKLTISCGATAIKDCLRRIIGRMAHTNNRRSPRCAFVLTAEVTNEQARTFIARLRSLNLNGCYVELGTPLPEGTSITIKVAAGKTVFEARGKVVYSDLNKGSGVEFQEVEPLSKSVLEGRC